MSPQFFLGKNNYTETLTVQNKQILKQCLFLALIITQKRIGASFLFLEKSFINI